MKTLRLCFMLVLALVALAPATAQDTRGSLVPDTLVATTKGPVAVQDLDEGDTLVAFGPTGAVSAAKVVGIRRQHADSYILLKAGGAEVQATGSHRVALAGYKLVRLDTVKVGDKVLVQGATGIEAADVTSVRVYPANLVAYDLTVEGHRMFAAGGVVVGD
jgi:hypothetical protein